MTRVSQLRYLHNPYLSVCRDWMRNNKAERRRDSRVSDRKCHLWALACIASHHVCAISIAHLPRCSFTSRPGKEQRKKMNDDYKKKKKKNNEDRRRLLRKSQQLTKGINGVCMSSVSVSLIRWSWQSNEWSTYKHTQADIATSELTEWTLFLPFWVCTRQQEKETPEHFSTWSSVCALDRTALERSTIKPANRPYPSSLLCPPFNGVYNFIIIIIINKYLLHQPTNIFEWQANSAGDGVGGINNKKNGQLKRVINFGNEALHHHHHHQRHHQLTQPAKSERVSEVYQSGALSVSQSCGVRVIKSIILYFYIGIKIGQVVGHTQHQRQLLREPTAQEMAGLKAPAQEQETH